MLKVQTRLMAGATQMARRCFCYAIVLAALAPPLLSAGRALAEGSLPSLSTRSDGVSVSGISAGAYMAGQFQIAHSKIVDGAAIIAGGPYGCAKSGFSDFVIGPMRAYANLSKAVNGCMLNHYAAWGIPDIAHLVRQANQLAASKAIDPLEWVRNDRIYLFSGKNDRTVKPAIVAAAGTFYEQLGVDPANIKRVSDYPAGHAFVTESEGAA